MQRENGSGRRLGSWNTFIGLNHDDGVTPRRHPHSFWTHCGRAEAQRTATALNSQTP
jgi:hypothetical protein